MCRCVYIYRLTWLLSMDFSFTMLRPKQKKKACNKYPTINDKRIISITANSTCITFQCESRFALSPNLQARAARFYSHNGQNGIDSKRCIKSSISINRNSITFQGETSFVSLNIHAMAIFLQLQWSKWHRFKEERSSKTNLIKFNI